jgi:hypothetical protein
MPSLLLPARSSNHNQETTVNQASAPRGFGAFFIGNSSKKMQLFGLKISFIQVTPIVM